MTVNPPFVELLRHNLWANLRLLDACAGLEQHQLDASSPGTYGTVGATLVHIIANEYGYAAALRQSPPAGRLDYRAAFPGVDAMRAHARASGTELIEAAVSLDPNAILRGEYQGQPFEMPAMTPLLQAVNHGTEHRAHIATILTTLGIEPPEMDVWMYRDSGAMSEE
jgi:uncharacterized damage-inducible protein DinB